MKKTVTTISLIIIVVFTLFLFGCSIKSNSGSGEVDTKQPQQESISLLITKNFGQEVILNKKVTKTDNITVFDVLNKNSEITTAYGGGFIQSINGLESKNNILKGQRWDWFYYVNGVFADMGAQDYTLRGGEVVWWDYHLWNRGIATNAVIGCYPEPFLHGYDGKVKPTSLLSSQNYNDLKQKLGNSLKELGVSHIRLMPLDQNQIVNRKGPVIVIGTWDELLKVDWLKELNQAYARNGTYIHFTPKGVELLNANGDIAQTIDGEVGAVFALGEGNGDDSPVWVVTANDEGILKRALDIMITQPEKISHAYSVVITPENIISLPVE